MELRPKNHTFILLFGTYFHIGSLMGPCGQYRNPNLKSQASAPVTRLKVVGAIGHCEGIHNLHYDALASQEPTIWHTGALKGTLRTYYWVFGGLGMVPDSFYKCSITYFKQTSDDMGSYVGLAHGIAPVLQRSLWGSPAQVARMAQMNKPCFHAIKNHAVKPAMGLIVHKSRPIQGGELPMWTFTEALHPWYTASDSLKYIP